MQTLSSFLEVIEQLTSRNRVHKARYPNIQTFRSKSNLIVRIQPRNFLAVGVSSQVLQDSQYSIVPAHRPNPHRNRGVPIGVSVLAEIAKRLILKASCILGNDAVRI